MSASTSEMWGEACGEWDELPVDGSEAWLGILLMAASGVCSVKGLIWLGTIAGQFIMR